jgi:hypothetical protein
VKSPPDFQGLREEPKYRQLPASDSRFDQLAALAADPDPDVSECAQADLFHEYDLWIETQR